MVAASLRQNAFDRTRVAETVRAASTLLSVTVAAWNRTANIRRRSAPPHENRGGWPAFSVCHILGRVFSFLHEVLVLAQYVYTMHRVGKIVPPKREILKDISLSFFPGAKIGVLGLNGAGKSTLLRIMAGVDTEIEGEARPMPGINVGYLPQEPKLDPQATVRDIVEEAVGQIKQAQARLDEVYAAYAEPDADFDALAAEQAKLEAILQASDGHNLERQLEVAADALRLPPWDAKVEHLSGGEKRRVALCRLLLSAPRHAAAGRTDQPPGRRLGGLAGAFLHDFPAPWWRSPTTATSSTTSPAGSSNSTVAMASRSKATTPAGWNQGRPPGPGSQAGSLPRQGHEGRAGVGTPGRQGPPSPRRACSASRNCSRRNSRSAARPTRSTSRPVRAWATRSSNCTM